MVLTNVTMNLTALQNIEPLNISISGSNSLFSIINSANTSVNDYIILFTMGMMLLILYWVLSDKTTEGDFVYDDFRALNIALSIASMFGLTMVEIGWSKNFYFVGIFIFAWLFSYIAILIYGNKE